jgi:hypothetical protein
MEARPFSLSETTAMELANRCVEMQDPGIIKLPREYPYGESSVFQRYPELNAAQKSRLLIAEREGNSIVQRLGITGGVFIREAGDFFEIDLGRRRMVRVKGMQGDVDHVAAQFEWEWEQKAAAEILTGSRGSTASANYVRQNDYWTMTGGTLKKGRDEWLGLCRKKAL